MGTLLTYSEKIKETERSITVRLGEDYGNKKLCIQKSKVPRTNYNFVNKCLTINEGFLNWLLKQNGI